MDSGRRTSDEASGVRAHDEFLRRLFITAGLFVLALLALLAAWHTIAVILLAYAGILIAIFLHGLARAAGRRLTLPYRAVFFVVLALLIVVGGVALSLLAPHLVNQFEELQTQLPQIAAQFSARIERYPWLSEYFAGVRPTEAAAALRQILGRVPGLFSTTFGALGSVFVVFFISVYLAMDPLPYIRGVLQLLPPRARPRGEQVLCGIGHTLWRWILGRLFGMTVVGLFTGLGLWWLDVPLAISLGILAGLLDFIPTIGPVLAAVPAVAIAFIQDPWLAVYVIALYFAVQAVEGNILLPLIEKRAVLIPPALTLFVQLLMYVLFGFLGLVLAIPLFAAFMVAVKMLYVSDLLGERAELPP